jgi:lysophospholipase L1-like esterase
MGRFNGKRLFIIGDSMSDGTEGRTRKPQGATMGEQLAQLLLARGATEVRLDARGGRSAYSLFHSAKEVPTGNQIVAEEITKRKPDYVLIILGTNDLGYSAKTTSAAMLQIITAAQAVGAQVIHVGPPTFPASRKLSATDTHTMNALTAQLITTVWVKLPDLFVDARPMTTDLVTTAQGRAGDGVHFTKKGGGIWAARLAKALDDEALVETATTGGMTGGQKVALVAAGVLVVGAAWFVASTLRAPRRHALFAAPSWKR